MTDRLRDVLRTEAQHMEMPAAMPDAVRRSIRRRRLGSVLTAVATVAAVVLGAVVLPDVVGGGRDVDVVSGDGTLRAGRTLGAIQTTDPRVVGRGRHFGMPWELVVSKAPSGPCLELQVERRAELCFELGGDWGRGFEAFLGHDERHALSYVFGVIPPDSSGVSISVRGGGQWAGLIFQDEQDDRSYFVRVFPSGNTSGIISPEEGRPILRFSVSRNDSSLSIAGSSRLPGFEDVEGETTVLYSDPSGDTFTDEAFDVVLGVTDDEVCLYIDRAETCTERAEPTGLLLSSSARVGKGAVIAALFGDGVEEISIESTEGDRWPQQLQPVPQGDLEQRFFVFEAEAPFEGRLAMRLADGSTMNIPLDVE